VGLAFGTGAAEAQQSLLGDGAADFLVAHIADRQPHELVTHRAPKSKAHAPRSELLRISVRMPRANTAKSPTRIGFTLYPASQASCFEAKGGGRIGGIHRGSGCFFLVLILATIHAQSVGGSFRTFGAIEPCNVVESFLSLFSGEAGEVAQSIHLCGFAFKVTMHRPPFIHWARGPTRVARVGHFAAFLAL
jgi:hypothetical protein